MSSYRDKWNSNLTFLLAMIGAAVGLGNIWRFPYVFYSNGQGTFLIPYLVAILIMGLPFMLLEYSVGAKFNDTLLNTFKKIGSKYQIFAWAIMITAFLIVTYYFAIVGWDLNYFVLSFTKGWGSNPDYFFNNVLLQSNREVFTFVPCILIAVVILWVINWFISSRDINEGIGKFTSIFVPILFILGIGIALYNVTLPGAYIGIMRFFTPNWSLLLSPGIWFAAFGQIIFTLSLGVGVILTYASRLPDKTNLTKNAAIVILANCGFEVINAIGVFSILGYMAYSTGVPFDNLITEGSGLAFVAFPQVFNVMGDVGYILGPLFFFCILIAGITTSIAYIESFADSLSFKLNLSRFKTVSLLVIVGCLISLLFTTTYGSFFVKAFDTVLNNVIFIFLIIVQCLLFGHILNINKLMEILNKKRSFKVGLWWKYIIQYVLPICLAIIWCIGIYTLAISSDSITLIVYLLILIFVMIISFILNYFTKDNFVGEKN